MKAPVAKQYLTEALFRLMEKKDYRSISVSRLVAVAGVSRSSFYRNYYDILDIVDEFYKDTFNEIYAKHPIYENKMNSTVVTIFKEFKSKRKAFELLKKQGLLNRMNGPVYDVTLNEIQRMNLWNNRYQPYFFAGAAYSLVKAWIDFGFEETEQELAEIFFKSLEGYMNG